MSGKKVDPDFTDINTILDKMIQLEKSRNKISVYKVILLVAGCLAMMVIVIALFMIFYKNEFSLESIISLLLAFFSIFISIFFYFKADETSNRFYDTSYDFMKEVSVTLGKIEERFGEKLNSLNDKVSHISLEKEEKREELQNVEDEKQRVIDELIDKSKLDADEKEEYLERLKEKEKEADILRHQLRMIDMKYKNMMRDRDSMYSENEILSIMMDSLTPKEKKLILNSLPSDWPMYLTRKMRNLNFLDKDGNLTPRGEAILENLKNSILVRIDE